MASIVRQVAKDQAEPCTIFIRETRDLPFFMQTAQRAISLIKQPINCLIIKGAALANLFYAMPKHYRENSGAIAPNFSTVLDISDNAIVRFTACDFKYNYFQLFVDSINRCRTLQSFELVFCSNIDETLISQLGQNQNLTTLTVRQYITGGLSLGWNEKLNEQMKLIRKITHLVIHDMNLNVTSVQSTCLKVVSLCDCLRYPYEGLALMKHLAKCPIEKLELNNNYLDGTFEKLCKLPDISYPHLESMTILTKRQFERNDLCGIAHLLHNGKLPVLRQIMLTGSDSYMGLYGVNPMEEFVKSCRLFREGQCKVVQRKKDVVLLPLHFSGTVVLPNVKLRCPTLQAAETK